MKVSFSELWFFLDDNPVVPVGETLEYHCPDGHFFEHDFYAPTKARILCQPDGTFWEPLINGSWPTCIIRELENFVISNLINNEHLIHLVPFQPSSLLRIHALQITAVSIILTIHSTRIPWFPSSCVRCFVCFVLDPVSCPKTKQTKHLTQADGNPGILKAY